MELHYANADGAVAGEKASKAAIGMARDQLKELEVILNEVIDKPTPGDRPVGAGEFPERFAAPLGLGAVRQFDEAIEKLPVERRGTMV